MRSEEQDFRELQKLLAVMRHEQPPPRFFHDFAERVLSRLHTVEPPEPKSWWQRMGLDFDMKPALVCVWGIASCAALLYGIIVTLLPGDDKGAARDRLGPAMVLLALTNHSTFHAGASIPQSTEPLYVRPNSFGID